MKRKNCHLCVSLVGMLDYIAIMKSSMGFFKTLQLVLPCNWVISLLDVYSKEFKMSCQRDICIHIIIIAKRQKLLKCPLTDERIGAVHTQSGPGRQLSGQALFLLKHEDLSLNRQHLGTVMCACNPGAGCRRPADPGSLLSNQPGKNGELQVQRETLF